MLQIQLKNLLKMVCMKDKEKQEKEQIMKGTAYVPESTNKPLFLKI